jgi:hypothetical protein
MMKSFEGSDLLGYEELIKDPNKNEGIIAALTSGQLKVMSDAGLSAEAKLAIGNKVIDWADSHDQKQHQAYDFIVKNSAGWTKKGESEAGHTYSAPEVRRILGV